jgi:hypothetical protein
MSDNITRILGRAIDAGQISLLEIQVQYLLDHMKRLRVETARIANEHNGLNAFDSGYSRGLMDAYQGLLETMLRWRADIQKASKEKESENESGGVESDQANLTANENSSDTVC